MTDLQLAPGSLFANRFEIDRAAGSGGMGTVYRARDRHSGDWVALKLLHPGSARPDEGERFTREAQILSELRHPGIVSHVAHGLTPRGQRFLAMEWLDGQDLGQHLRRGPMPLRDCIVLISQVADGLSAAHACGIIHRDLKPSNLFLYGGDTARIKILDFGIARRITSSHAMTKTGMVIGTPEYMAPEQARGSRDLTQAADLFSLGCVLYECLTGQPPFVADHIAAVLVRILFEEPAPIEERRPGVPAALAALLSRVLLKDPVQRLADATTFRAELLSLGGLPDAGLAVTLAGPRPKTEGFAEHEQNLFSIVLAAPPEDESGLGATLPGSAQVLAQTDRQALLQAVMALGAAPDYLANGSLLVTVSSTGSAQDQATRAARAALLIKERWPAAMVSMATGRGAIRGRTAVGEVVDLAARSLKSGSQPSLSAPAAGILLDTLSAKLLEGRFAQTPQPGGTLLLGEEREVDASRPLLGKPTPCVGREAELGTLESQLAGCIEESHARAVLVTAPPGAGKSRLRHEFLRRVERLSEPVTVLLGRGDLLQAGAAYAIVATTIRTLCGISENEDLSKKRQRLQERIERYLPAGEQARVVPFLGEICGVPFPEQEYPLVKETRQNPKLLPERLRRACLTWLAAECQAAPVLCILDDLHWGDELTIALLNEALRELRSAPLLVLALGRPEVHTTFPGLWKEHKPQEIELKGLSKRACERLIKQALGNQVSVDSVEWMVEQSAGNALFLEEMIRAAADGQLNKRPDTVLAMLQARIGHLASGSRRTVLAASVFGQTLWHGGVARLLQYAKHAPEIEDGLRALIDAELIEPHGSSRIPEEREYGFRHALVRDAAYGLLTENDQKLGHLLAAEFLEERAGQQISSAVLGFHFRQAGHLDKALQQYLRAGDRAARQFLLEEARINYAAAEETIGALPSTPALDRLHADILAKEVQCSLTAIAPNANFQRMAHAREMLEKLAKTGTGEHTDQLRLARLDWYCGRLHNYAGQPAQAIPLLHHALQVAREFEDQEIILTSSLMLGYALGFQGQILKSRALLEPVVPMMERLFGHDIDTMRAHLFLASSFFMSGQHTAGWRLIEYVRPWVDEAQQPVYTGIYQMFSGLALLNAGDWPEALNFGRRACKLGQDAKEPLIEYVSWDVSALAQSHLGNHQVAIENRKKAVERRRIHRGGILGDFFEASESEIYLRAGQFEVAAEVAERVARTSRPNELMLSLCVAERALGCALVQLGAEPTKVDERFHESLKVANTMGLFMEALWTQLAWGQVCKDRGDLETATNHFKQVQERLTDDVSPYVRGEFLEAIRHAAIMPI